MGCCFGKRAPATAAARADDPPLLAGCRDGERRHHGTEGGGSHHPPHGAAASPPGSAALAHSHAAAQVHAALPAGAEKAWCHHVYDGDTLTLDEGAGHRVRLLGIDTPEIKEKQPFAVEARDFTRDLCAKKDIWLVFQGGAPREDHYGRLLAFVWAAAPGGYVCVNEAIVAAGLAGFYSPKDAPPLPNQDTLLGLQAEARTAKRGKWADFTDRAVVKTKNGKAYHLETCDHLQKGWHLQHLAESEAQALGLSACRDCLS